MPRPRTLSDEQRIENKKNVSSNKSRVDIYITDNLFKKLDKFSKRYTSRNKCIIDLIKTHPDFLKMFPPISIKR